MHVVWLRIHNGQAKVGAESPVGAESWRGLESGMERNGLWRAGSSGSGGAEGESLGMRATMGPAVGCILVCTGVSG